MTADSLSQSPQESRKARLASELRPNRLLPALVTGAIVGVIEVIFAVSFSTLVFPGEASPLITRAIGLALLGSMLSGIVIALFTSLRGVVGGNQDVPAAILGVVVASVLAAMPAVATQSQIAATVLAAVAVTTLATGAFMLVLGSFRLGNLIRFLPYPVIGGFLAGTGWLLAVGGINGARIAQDSSAVRYIVLDFKYVTGIDSTAALSFSRMEQIAGQNDIALIFAGASEPVQQQLQRTGIIEENRPLVQLFPDLDRAVEWCEEEILRASGWTATETDSLAEQLAALIQDRPAIDHLMPYLQRQELTGRERLMRQGDRPDDMYFLQTGQVTAQVEEAGKPPRRLETMRGGPTVVGDLGFYLGYERGASVVVDEPSVVYRLTRNALEEMEAAHPAAASVLHRAVAILVANRTVHLIRVVNVLET